jgi:hypothetical protein
MKVSSTIRQYTTGPKPPFSSGLQSPALSTVLLPHGNSDETTVWHTAILEVWGHPVQPGPACPNSRIYLSNQRQSSGSILCSCSTGKRKALDNCILEEPNLHFMGVLARKRGEGRKGEGREGEERRGEGRGEERKKKSFRG